MRRFITALILTSLLLVTFPLSYAQRANDKLKKGTPVSTASQRGIDTITGSQIRDYLTFIASDEMEGRDTPSRGLDITAKFLAMNLARWGFKPAGDNGTFLQRIDLRRDRADGAQSRLELNGRVLTTGTEYIPVSGSGSIKGQLVFAGNGWFMKSKQMDAYKGIDATGKIAVVMGSPNAQLRGVQRSQFGKQGEDYMNPTDYARKVGAVGLVYIPDYSYLANWERNRQRTLERGTLGVAKFQTQTQTVPQIPMVVVAPEVANSILAGETQSNAIFNTAPGASLPASFALNSTKTISLSLSAKSEIVPTQNVVAVWEGSDPVLKNEYVAIGAHYDHVGICAPNRPDPICNGADDDGSGTTAVLSIAEALTKASTRPKRSVLFVWHCGEEKGLWGSRYFTEYPTVPLDKIVTQINIDMIGRSKKTGDTNARNKDLTGPTDIYLIGSTMMSTELGEIVQSVNKSYLNIGYDTRYDDPADRNRFFFRSDHYNYAKKGIPIIFYFDGVHEDYHQAGDSADKIDYEKMEKITRTVYMTLWEIANRATRPKVDKPLPAQLSTN